MKNKKHLWINNILMRKKIILSFLLLTLFLNVLYVYTLPENVTYAGGLSYNTKLNKYYKSTTTVGNMASVIGNKYIVKNDKYTVILAYSNNNWTLRVDFVKDNGEEANVPSYFQIRDGYSIIYGWADVDNYYLYIVDKDHISDWAARVQSKGAAFPYMIVEEGSAKLLYVVQFSSPEDSFEEKNKLKPIVAQQEITDYIAVASVKIETGGPMYVYMNANGTWSEALSLNAPSGEYLLFLSDKIPYTIKIVADTTKEYNITNYGEYILTYSYGELYINSTPDIESGEGETSEFWFNATVSPVDYLLRVYNSSSGDLISEGVGNVSVSVPENTSLRVEIYDDKGNLVFTENISIVDDDVTRNYVISENSSGGKKIVKTSSGTGASSGTGWIQNTVKEVPIVELYIDNLRQFLKNSVVQPVWWLGIIILAVLIAVYYISFRRPKYTIE